MHKQRPMRKPALPSTASKRYRFLNPYNFVRTLDVRNQHLAPLLGRCAPPPHDRYIGLTGRVHCRLTATTPVFVSDSEEVKSEMASGKTHQSYRFFRDPDGNVAIPGTSLRGAIRSVFEAATNSCFAHFAGHKRLSYRLPPEQALQLVPARVREANGRWELELLPGTTPIALGQRPSGPQYAAWVHVYHPLQQSTTIVQSPSEPYAKRKKLSLHGFKHGERCKAIIERMKHPRRNFEFWNVVHLVKDEQLSPKPANEQLLVEGYLCITNQNIGNKHDERLFFTTQQLQPIVLPKEVREEYEALITDYQERHSDEVRKRQHQTQSLDKEPDLSRFITESTTKLTDGDLVYAMLEGDPNVYKVKFIVPVSVPRVRFKRAIGELLHPSELAKCTEYSQLCPACRVFGWVRGDEAEQEEPSSAAVTAYAGRVRFSHAVLQHDAGTFDATLSILSSPKPTTYRFYLRPQNRKPQNGLDDKAVNYDNSNQILRGRKFYRHHGNQLSQQEYQSVNGAKSDQNRTVCNVQQAGSTFEFTVDFENLAAIELGALLWSLWLEGWHHRLGYAKPLGFGSVQIEILQVKLLNTKTCYTSLCYHDTWQEVNKQQIDRWIGDFKKAMSSSFGKTFDQLDNIRDLKALLSTDPPLPVHYPRSTPKPQPNGKQYEWFVSNKRSGQNPGPRIALPLAEDDVDGLPLI